MIYKANNSNFYKLLTTHYYIKILSSCILINIKIKKNTSKIHIPNIFCHLAKYKTM